MNVPRIGRLFGALTAAALLLSGCAVNEMPGYGGANIDSPLSGQLAGIGSSAQEVGVQAWAAGFQMLHPRVTVTYDPAGSGAGREAFQAGAVPFAGSDRAFRLSEVDEGRFDGCVDGTGIIQLPAYIAPLTVIFNIDGISSLNLDPDTIAGMFTGAITTWDHPDIVRQNEGATLPRLAVTPVHRADDSGTTTNFTDYLFQAAPRVWTHEPSGVWPLTSGEAAQGTSGVVAAVASGQGTISYADASRAAEFGTVAVKVAGEYVEFSPEAAAAIVDVSPFEEGRAPGDLAVALDRTPDTPAYPIVLVSYSIACQQYADPAVAELVSSFLEHAISEAGQSASQKAAGSAPITPSQRDAMQAAIDLIVTQP